MNIYEKAGELVRQGNTIAFAHITAKKGSAPRATGAKMIVKKDSTIIGTVGGGPLEIKVIQEALGVLKNQVSCNLEYDLEKDLNMPCGGQVQVFIEVLTPLPRLLISGAGHVGHALARFARELDWDVILTDEYAEMVSIEKMPDGVIGYSGDSYIDAVNQAGITPNTYLVIVTKDADFEIVEEYILSSACYIGMIGSRRKAALIMQKLKDKAIPPERLEIFHAPIGLDIQAETPEEIAVSILSELIMVYRQSLISKHRISG